jgi:hypothetical protein
VRLVAPLALAALVLSGCGGSSPQAAQPVLAGAPARTTAAGTVHVTLDIAANVAGRTITASENGNASFNRRQAHLYKLVPGGGVPREVVVVGPYIYSNANVEAALADRTVKPWTKLDTRRLSAKQRRSEPDELAHVLAPAYLADGVAQPVRVGSRKDGSTQFTGRVDPARLEQRLPPARRAAIMAAVRNDYEATPFEASFWVDDRGRVRRVLVSYRTAQGTRITVEASYSNFGTAVDLTVPPASGIQDISP